MHETVVAKRLFNEAQEMAFRLGIDRINRLKVRLGIASGIDKEMLRISLIEFIFPETIAEDAEVDITLEPLIARCSRCQAEISANEMTSSAGCPACGSKDLDVKSGVNVTLEEIT